VFVIRKRHATIMGQSGVGGGEAHLSGKGCQIRKDSATFEKRTAIVKTDGRCDSTKKRPYVRKGGQSFIEVELGGEIRGLNTLKTNEPDEKKTGLGGEGRRETWELRCLGPQRGTRREGW